MQTLPVILKRLTKKWKIRTRGGLTIFYRGIPRAWGDNAFWKFRRQQGVKIWTLSAVWYGYFLESPTGVYRVKKEHKDKVFKF